MKALIGAVALATVHLSGVFSASAEIVVGVNLSLTGPAATLGASWQRSLAMAPKEIGGEPVRYVILDDGTDPSAAVRNVRKLAGESKADVLLGPTNAPAGYAIAPILSELKIPLISGTPIELYGDKAHWFASALQPNPVWVAAIVDHMKATGIKRIGYIGYSDTYGDIILRDLKALTEKAGIEIIAEERFARSDTSVTGQVLRIVAANPDAVMIGASASPSVLPNVTLRDYNFDKPRYNTPVAVGPDFLRLGGDRVDGAYASSFLIVVASQLPESHPSRTVAMDFIKRFNTANPDRLADGQAGESYDVTLIMQNVLAAALKSATPGTEAFRLAVRDAMYKIKELPGTLGVYNFVDGQPYGLDQRSIVLVQVHNGLWTIVQ
jgi:branched-chain amino acid transport system substrate-binding protein